MAESNVKVAVRVRPFNRREKELNCKLVVDMNTKQTILLPHQGDGERRFTFDYSFWSFDGYEQDSKGYLKYFCYQGHKSKIRRSTEGVRLNGKRNSLECLSRIQLLFICLWANRLRKKLFDDRLRVKQRNSSDNL